ncbi:hypothetical protein B879_03440 [Cecembia lonarensis LW9]|uniref:Uncharacterized protein n=2 Tax=Cecembia TaxID=1187078 RepID=K1KZK3_CECL9|nr:hypothetical protein B879_03440 [Cecembia lonarensis LW9]
MIMKTKSTKYLLLIYLSVLPILSFGQIKSIYYNVVSNELNNSNPIPSEEPFFVKGRLPVGIEMVKVSVNRAGKNENRAVFYEWKRAFDFEVSEYELFVSNPLRNNDRYDMEFFFYGRADEQQMEKVIGAIHRNLDAYIRANMEVKSSGIKTNHSDPVLLSQMNQIVNDGLQDYRHFLGRDFQGFSEVVRQKLDQKNRLKLRRARFNVLGRNREDNARAAYAEQYIQELIQLVQNESSQYLDKSLLALVDIRSISNYPTEKKPNALPLNFGYATIPIKRTLPSTEYLHGPYVGLSLPLGNRAFTKFLGNASFSTGIFLTNFESSQGDRISGELIGLPIYAGLGYKMFQVFRLNVGAVMLNFEESNSMGNSSTYIQPFAGISLEFNLWLGLKDRR